MSVELMVNTSVLIINMVMYKGMKVRLQSDKPKKNPKGLKLLLVQAKNILHPGIWNLDGMGT